MGSSYITGLLVEQRLSELRAEADRERLARAARRPRRPGRRVAALLARRRRPRAGVPQPWLEPPPAPTPRVRSTEAEQPAVLQEAGSSAGQV